MMMMIRKWGLVGGVSSIYLSNTHSLSRDIYKGINNLTSTSSLKRSFLHTCLNIYISLSGVRAASALFVYKTLAAQRQLALSRPKLIYAFSPRYLKFVKFLRLVNDLSDCIRLRPRVYAGSRIARRFIAERASLINC
jgi:hypothetical protein